MGYVIFCNPYQLSTNQRAMMNRIELNWNYLRKHNTKSKSHIFGFLESLGWIFVTPTNYQQTNVQWWIELNVLQLEILEKAEYKRQNFWPSRSCREPPTTDVWWLFPKFLTTNIIFGIYLGYVCKAKCFVEKRIEWWNTWTRNSQCQKGCWYLVRP